MSPHHISYWLIPASRLCEYYEPLITDLAKKYAAPPFSPHVTLYSAEGNVADAPRICEAVAPKLRQLGPVEVEGVAYGTKYTETLFVRLSTSPELERLSRQCRRAVGGSAYELKPHMSILYCELSEEQKEHLVRGIQIPHRQLTFCEVRAIETPSPVSCRADVEAWKVVGSAEMIE